MKDVKKLHNKFIAECKNKMKSKKITFKEIAKATSMSDSTIKDFFKGSDAKIKTVLKILNAMNLKLKLN